MRVWGLGALALLLSACGGAVSAGSNAPVVIPANPSTTRIRELSAPDRNWTWIAPLNARLPLTESELDELVAESSFVGTLNGRPVWVVLDGVDTQRRLARVAGPTTIRLQSLEPEILTAVASLARRYPIELDVDLTFEAGDVSGLSRLSGLQGLRLVAPSSRVPTLSNFPALRRLDLTITDGGAELNLAFPPRLQELNLSHTNLDNRILPAIARLAELRVLICPRGVDAQAFVSLRRLSKLEALSLAHLYTKGEQLDALQAFPRLRQLTLGSLILGDRAPAVLARLPELRELDISEARMSPRGIEELTKLTQLEGLSPPTGGAADALLPLRALQALTRLHLPSGRGVDLSFLRDLPQLRELELGGADDASVTLLEPLVRLRRLRLDNSILGGAGLDSLSKLHNLRELTLDALNASDTEIAKLAKLRELRVLRLGAAPGAAALSALATLPHLHQLDAEVHGTSQELLRFPRLLFFRRGDCAWLQRQRPLLKCQ